MCRNMPIWHLQKQQPGNMQSLQLWVSYLWCFEFQLYFVWEGEWNPFVFGERNLRFCLQSWQLSKPNNGKLRSLRGRMSDLWWAYEPRLPDLQQKQRWELHVLQVYWSKHLWTNVSQRTIHRLKHQLLFPTLLHSMQSLCQYFWQLSGERRLS